MKLMESIRRDPVRVGFGRRGGGTGTGEGNTGTLPPPPAAVEPPDFETRGVVQTSDVDTNLSFLRTAGFAVVGDGGGGVYVRTSSEPSHDGKIQSADGAWWELQADDGCFAVEQFGATGDGVVDDFAAIDACVQTAIARSNTRGHALAGGGGTTFAITEVKFTAGKSYRLSQKIIADNARIDLVGQRAVLFGDDFNDYLIEFTGQCFRQRIEGLTFECTRAGAIKWVGNNSSGSMVHVEDCRFVTDPHGHDTAIAIDYVNRSSSISIKRSFFNKVKHAAHFRNCDFMSFEDCWFGFPVDSVFADRDGYVRVDKGFCRVHNCLFAGGPAADPVGGGAANGSEIAFFNVGIEGIEAPDEDHARIAIKDTRIGFESGAGALVNYFVSHKDNVSAQFRSGIVLENIQTSPREAKEPNILGADTAAVLRLFEMPHQILVNGVYSSPVKLALVTPGSTTTLAALRAQASTPINHSADFMDQLNCDASNNYAITGLTTVEAHVVLTTDTVEYNRWLELFGRFNYVFTSDFPNKNSAGNTPTATIDTWFTDFSEQLGAVFEVQGGADARINNGLVVRTPIHGYVHVQLDEAGDAVRASYFDAVNTAALPLGVTITAELKVGSTYSPAVSVANASSATLAIRVQHGTNPGVTNIRCRGLLVRPATAQWPNGPGANMLQA